MNTKQIGMSGEEIACNYVEDKGYKVVIENWGCKWGEIDIVAKDKNTIVFIEVKYRSNIKFGYPYEYIDKRKRGRLLKSIDLFLKKHSFNSRGYRFDVISMYRKQGQLFIDHFQNVQLE